MSSVDEEKVDANEINIEDPVNFLTTKEKHEYMLAHQETIARGDVPLERYISAYDKRTRKKKSAHRENGAYDDEAYEDGDGYEDDASYDDGGYDDEANDGYEQNERRTRVKKSGSSGKRNARGYAAESDEGLDRNLSTAVKVGLIAIGVIIFIMIWMLLIIPLFNRAFGNLSDGTSARADSCVTEQTMCLAENFYSEYE